MVTLTPELAGNSLLILGISYVVIFIFYAYSLWLNWKQSKVRDQMKELIELMKKIEKNTR